MVTEIENRARISCCRLNRAAWWVESSVFSYVGSAHVAGKEFDDNCSPEAVVQPCASCRWSSSTSLQRPPGPDLPAAHSLPIHMRVSENMGGTRQRYDSGNASTLWWPQGLSLDNEFNVLPVREEKMRDSGSKTVSYPEQ